MTWTLRMDALDEENRPVTLRFSLGRYDAPDNAFYDPRMLQPGLYQGGMYAGQLLRQSRSGHGQTTLNNSDGALDHLADYAVDGRAMVLALNGVDQVRGTVARLTFSDDEVAVVLRDPLEPLNTPHPMDTYAGTNVLPNGVEGTEDDIAGEPKPQVWGTVDEATPRLVNSAQLIYQVSSLTDCRVTAVHDRGVALDHAGECGSLAELERIEPARGTFKAYQGFIKLGGEPRGGVTVSAQQADPRAGAVAHALAAARGYTLHAGDVAALNGYGNVRLFLDQENDTLTLLDYFAESIGGYLSIQPDGVLRLRELQVPQPTAAAIQDYSIAGLRRSSTGAGDNGLPIWRVTLEYDRIETVSTDLAGDVNAARRARVSQQYRKHTAEDQAVRARHPLAGEMTIQTVLVDRSKAQAVAGRVLQLVSVRRDTLEIESLEVIAPSVGEGVTLITPRLGYAAGRPLIITGYRLNAEADELTISAWG
ncbi:hypothetical protein [Vreelandella populi]|uniref:hypothetical protein n=1 Tax=Vreelandella populi TaxID=2498858 RepID=UPI000F8CF318|nr:hypothetical protein [Halomonas populi]RUR51532.1 hypothetical protein ELY40_17195 [Halomonas populi]